MIRDDFAGPGGWEEGARLIGLDGIIGVEHDLTACQTASAAGHARILADVAAQPSERWGGLDGYIASPPCTAFSSAGLRHGVAALPLILAAIDGAFRGDPEPARTLAEECQDATASLVIEPARVAYELRPPWIALEQVPPVLPVWVRIAEHLTRLGYSARAGVLNSADYGVPQTRQRAILIASLERHVELPLATHAKNPAPTLFGNDLLPWVSMARALGWLDGIEVDYIADPDNPAPTLCGKHTPRWLYPKRVGFPRLDDLGTSEDGYRERDWRPVDEPSFAVTEKARSWIIDTDDVTVEFPGGANRAIRTPDEPAATIAFGHDATGFVVRTGNNSHVTSREGSKAGDGGVELYERSVMEPAPTLDRKVGAAWRVVGVNTGRDWKEGGTREDAQVVDPEEPAPTVDSKGRWHALLAAAPWGEDRPATTVAGDSRLWPPGHKINADDIERLGEEEATERYGDRAGTDAIRLGIDEALVLQSFRPDYPVHGNKTKQFEQVGNAIPPLLAAHVLAAATGRTPPQGGTP